MPKQGLITVHGAVSLITQECRTCGVTYAMPETLHEARMEDGGHWYCPNGHVCVCGKTVTEELEETRRENAALKELVGRAILPPMGT